MSEHNVREATSEAVIKAVIEVSQQLSSLSGENVSPAQAVILTEAAQMLVSDFSITDDEFFGDGSEIATSEFPQVHEKWDYQTPYFSAARYERAAQHLRSAEDEYLFKMVDYWGETFLVTGVLSAGPGLIAHLVLQCVDIPSKVQMIPAGHTKVKMLDTPVQIEPPTPDWAKVLVPDQP